MARHACSSRRPGHALHVLSTRLPSLAASLARRFARAICRSTCPVTLNSFSATSGLKPLFRGESFDGFVDSSNRTRSLRR